MLGGSFGPLSQRCLWVISVVLGIQGDFRTKRLKRKHKEAKVELERGSGATWIPTWNLEPCLLMPGESVNMGSKLFPLSVYPVLLVNEIHMSHGGCGGQRTTLGVSPCLLPCLRQGMFAVAHTWLAGFRVAGDALFFTPLPPHHFQRV